jgi:cyclophilin family peptidyl-prolyl cis-trans isomerase
MTRATLLMTALTAGLLMAGCTSTTSNTNTDESGLALAPTIETKSVSATPEATPTATSASKLTTNNSKEKVMTSATIETNKGNIVVKLYPDSAPNTVKNFETKAKSGFYKNLTFHRVEDWVIQGGDPLGTGTGGGDMPTELSQVPFKTGSLGVARGQNRAISNDSQLFICTTDCSWLTGEYTNFGEVTQGMDVAKKIAIGDKILGITVQ